MKQAASRGARFTFVNPRRIETPDKGIGDTVQIRPDTDVYLLAALLHEIDRLGGLDEGVLARHGANRSEEHTSELQSLMRISYAVFCLKKKKIKTNYSFLACIRTYTSNKVRTTNIASSQSTS